MRAEKAPLPRSSWIAAGRPATSVRASSVVACVDASNHLPSVCDHAAWLAGRLGASIELLHVEEPAPTAAEPAGSPLAHQALDQFRLGMPGALPAAIDAAASRLVEEGAEVLEFCSARGHFAPIAATLAEGAEVLVVGRRGTRALADRRPFGSSLVELLRRSRAPVFVAPLVFLPIRRALVVQTGARWPDDSSDFLAMSRVLDGLSIEIMQTEPSDARPDGETTSCSGSAVQSYFTSNTTDLLVLSRTGFLEAPAGTIAPCQSVLAQWRLPMLLY